MLCLLLRTKPQLLTYIHVCDMLCCCTVNTTTAAMHGGAQGIEVLHRDHHDAALPGGTLALEYLCVYCVLICAYSFLIVLNIFTTNFDIRKVVITYDLPFI